MTVISVRQRVEKILGEMSEAKRDEALELTMLFPEDQQVGLAEMLLDAQRAGKYPETKVRLRELPEERRTLGNIVMVYTFLGLRPTGGERS